MRITANSRAVRGALILTLLLAAPVQGQQAPVPPPAPTGPFTGFSQSALSLRDSVVARARSQIGKPYRFGGRSPSRGFDCSGFVQFVLAAFQLDVPRTAAQQAAVGFAVDRDTSRLRPGDLLTFGDGKRISHIGIYVGNGRYVHASSKAGRVVESRINRRAARVTPWRGVRRLLALNDADAAPAPVATAMGQ